MFYGKIMRKIAMGLSFLFALSPMVSFGESINKNLSLDQAIEIGIESSRFIEMNQLETEVKKIEKREASIDERRFNKLPSSFRSEAGYEDRAMVFLLEDEVNSLGKQYSIDELAYKTESVKSDLKNGITKAYYGVLMAKDNLSIEEENLNNINDNYRILKKKLEVGSESKSNLYLQEIELNNAKTKLTDSKYNYNMALRALNKILNYPLDAELNLTSGFDKNYKDIDLAEDLKKAYNNRYDYLVSQNNLDLLQKNHDAVKASYTPNTYRYKKSQLQLSIMETAIRDFRQDIEEDIKSNYDSIISAENQIKLSEENIKMAEEALRLTRLRYDLDSATILEVNQSITQLNQAKLGKSKALSDYNTALLDYYKAVNIGSLN